MNKNTNILLRKLIMEATKADIRNKDGEKVFTDIRRLVLCELAMSYNPKNKGCFITQDKLADQVGCHERTVSRTITLAGEYLGLRWIHINPVKTKSFKGLHDSNSYDFRHFDSSFNTAWRGDGKAFKFADRGNIDEPFNGKTLSFNPFRESSKSFDSPLKNEGGVGVTCAEYRAWFTRAINGAGEYLAAAIADHKKILKLSEEEAWKNVQIVIKSDLDDASRVELVRYCIHKNYKVIDPKQWQVKSSNDDDKALADALR